MRYSHSLFQIATFYAENQLYAAAQEGGKHFHDLLLSIVCTSHPQHEERVECPVSLNAIMADHDVVFEVAEAVADYYQAALTVAAHTHLNSQSWPKV